MEDVKRALRSAPRRRVVAQMATGAGKTAVATATAHAAVERGNRVWFTVHRRELVRQALGRMRDAGLDAVALMAGEDERHDAPVQVVSVDTFNARLRAGRALPPPPQYAIDDECHHVPTAKWEPIIQYAPTAVRVGLTATPWRLDGVGLAAVYDKLVRGPDPSTLVDSGYLVPFEMWAGPAPDLVGVPTRAGDFARAELAERSAKVVGDVVATYARVCAHARAICFAANRAHSESLADAFTAAGFPAWHIDFRTPDAERAAALAGFAAGAIKVLCNVEIVTEGFDVPACDAAILARATQSESLFLQMAGRACRPAPGKERALLLDHGNNVFRFGDPQSRRAMSIDGRRMKVPAAGDELADPPGIRLCEKCLRVYPQQRTECPSCGATYTPPPPKVDESVELQRVEAVTLDYARRAVRRARFKQLEAQMLSARKNPWSVSYAYKREFGSMPHDDGIFFSGDERRRYWAGRKRGPSG